LLKWFCNTHIWSIKCQLVFLDCFCNTQMLGIKYTCSMKKMMTMKNDKIKRNKLIVINNRKNNLKKRHRKIYILRNPQNKNCLHFAHKICNNYWGVLYLKWHCFHMWILYFVIGFSNTLTFNNNYQNMQYLCVGHKSWLNVQYSHSRLSFIDIKGSNIIIKMVVSSFSAILSYFVYHTFININIM